MITPRATWTTILNGTTLAIYRPEAFGVPGGVNPAVDMLLIQAAIDAATAAGGGTVRIDSTYAYGYIAGQDLLETIGPYSVSYGIWLNGSNITLDGNNTGKLVCPALPAGMVYPLVGLLIGNGGYNLGLDGSKTYAQLRSGTDTGLTNVIVKNFSIDNSALTDANLVTLTTGALGGCIAMCHCIDSEMSGITVDRGWGMTGPLSLHCSSLRCTVKDCTITLANDRGFHMDGPEDCLFDNLTVGGFVTETYGALGIATNTDYQHDSKNCTISNCHLTGGNLGISTAGSGNIITGNTIVMTDSNATTRVGIIAGVNTLSRNWACSNITITNNTISKPSALKHWGIYLDGVDVSPNDGQPITVSGCTITGNTFGVNLAIALVFGQSAVNNVFQHNTINCGQATVDISGGSATGNTIVPNP